MTNVDFATIKIYKYYLCMYISLVIIITEYVDINFCYIFCYTLYLLTMSCFLIYNYFYQLYCFR